MSENSEAWDDPYGCRDVSLAEDYVDELRLRIVELEQAYKLQFENRRRSIAELKQDLREMDAENDRLSTRTSKLEEALRYIANEGDDNWFTPMTDIAIDIARKALGEED